MHSIQLLNFQGHEDSHIDLAPTITAITGETNAGKTSISRAVRLVVENKPSVEQFLRKGTEDMGVIIDTVARIKQPKLNAYYIEGHEKPYKALRGGVPEQVPEELNIGVDNIQTQLKSIFLLEDTPGKRASKLAELVDLEPTTVALQYIKKQTREANAQIKATELSIKTTTEQIFDLRHTDKMDEELLKLEQKQVAIDRLTKKHTTLSKAHKNAVAAQIELNSLPNTKALQPARELQAQYTEIIELSAQINIIKKTINSIREYDKIIAVNPSKLLRRASRVVNMYDNIQNIQSCIGKIRVESANVDAFTGEAEVLDVAKKELIGDSCPLCGSAL